MSIEVRFKENIKKKTAIELRKRGFSYSDIQKSVPVSKSTLSFWLKDIKLTGPQIEKLNERKLKIAKANSERKILKTLEAIERIKKSSSGEIGKITKRELWLMGIVLYWQGRLSSNRESDLKNGVRFSSSDPFLIKIFLKWIQDIGGIKNNEIMLDLFIKEKDKGNLNRAINYWSDVTGFKKIYFIQIYVQKDNISILNRADNERGGRSSNNTKRSKMGFLRVRVKGSSMLARQIAGWMGGIQEYFWGMISDSGYEDAI